MHPRIPDVAGSSPGTGGCIWTRMPSAAGFKFGAAEPNPDAVLPVAFARRRRGDVIWRRLSLNSRVATELRGAHACVRII